MTSIESIPDEILSSIFEKYIELRLPVWDLIGVSQRWNQVAFSTPQLWNTLVISSPGDTLHEIGTFRDGLGVKNYYVGHKHMCHEEPHLRRCLSRCGDVLLNVEFRGTQASDEENNNLAKCLKILMEPPISERIRTFSLMLYYENVVDIEPECFHLVHLPNLADLTIYGIFPSRWSQDLIRVMSTSTRLHKLRFSFLPKLPDIVWRRLKILSISANPEQLNEIASKISHLKELGPLPFHWPNSKTPKMTFSNLHSISVTANTVHFRRLQLPNLLELNVSDPGGLKFDRNFTLDFTSFPKVSKLNVRGSHPEKWITNIHFPELKSFHLTIPRLNPILTPEVFLSTSLRTFTTLDTLILHGFVEDNMTIYLLDSLPSITALISWSVTSDPLYVSKLVSHLMEFDDERRGFRYGPNLKRIGLSGTSIDGASSSVVSLMQELASVRKVNNTPLQKLEITWKDKIKQDFALV
ncbi:hypothetical protein CPB86DRAFT_827705 [Serendipita vermifera]|nr:hypothetical protein CPB86DRAFT_827705 [Serendipita vermifera]